MRGTLGSGRIHIVVGRRRRGSGEGAPAPNARQDHNREPAPVSLNPDAAEARPNEVLSGDAEEVEQATNRREMTVRPRENEGGQGDPRGCVRGRGCRGSVESLLDIHRVHDNRPSAAAQGTTSAWPPAVFEYSVSACL